MHFSGIEVPVGSAHASIAVLGWMLSFSSTMSMTVAILSGHHIESSLQVRLPSQSCHLRPCHDQATAFACVEMMLLTYKRHSSRLVNGQPFLAPSGHDTF